MIAGFNLQTDCAELELYVNKFKVKESQFSALIEQYCQSVDFFIDVKIRGKIFYVTILLFIDFL